MTEIKDQAQSVFLNALEIVELEERAAYLDEECGSDNALRQEVDDLLDHAGRLGNFLNPSEVDERTDAGANRDDLVGGQIGPYKLRELLGEGGMGEVYVAEQTEPVRRKVALKIIKPGMATKDVIARFEAERQALAMMDHPNIARVFDGGVTASGQPYFVMELVLGVPITQYCDEHRLSTRERLELFLKTCQAVHHAHQKGIIHRDIKAGNVLVAGIDGAAIPIVIDFGVAKAIDQKLSTDTVYTNVSQMIGTPLYMSPEQATLGVADVDTRTDVYSLGVLLYELLTGHTPFDRDALTQADFDEMRRIIQEDAPPCPSAKVSTLKADALTTVTQKRRSDPRQLENTLRGELDWIVMKCLEKDRNRRYESASALENDVGRFLTNQAVEASPPSRLYRIRKFTQRNRAVIVTAASIALMLFAGLAGTSLQAIRASNAELAAREQVVETDRHRRQATAERNQAQRNLVLAERNLEVALETVDQMYLEVAQNWVADDVAASEVQIEFLKRAGNFYQQAIDQADAFGLSPAEVAQCHVRLAHVRAELAFEDLARDRLGQAIPMFEKALLEAAEDTKLLAHAAEAYWFFAKLHANFGDYTASKDANQKALTLFRRAVELLSGHEAIRAQLGVARAELQHAELLVKLNKLDEAAMAATAAGDIYCFGFEELWPRKILSPYKPSLFPREVQATLFLYRHWMHEESLRRLGEYENFLRCNWLLARIDRLQGRMEEANSLAGDLLGWMAEVESGGGRNRPLLDLEILLLEEQSQVSIARAEYKQAVSILRDVLAKRIDMLRGKQHPITFVDRAWHAGNSLGLGSRKFVQPRAFLDVAVTELQLARCLRELGRTDESLRLAVKAYYWLGQLADIVKLERAEVLALDAVMEIALSLENRWPEDAHIAALSAAHQWQRTFAAHPSFANYVSEVYSTQPDLGHYLQHFPQHNFIQDGKQVLGPWQPDYRDTESWLSKVDTYGFAAIDAQSPEPTWSWQNTEHDLRTVLRLENNLDAMAWMHLAMVHAKQDQPVRARFAHVRARSLVGKQGTTSEEFNELDQEFQRIDGYGERVSVGRKSSRRRPWMPTSTGPPEISISNAQVVAGDTRLRFLDDVVAAGSIFPECIAFGPDGNLYVADVLGDRVLRYDSQTGSLIDSFVDSGSGGLLRPFGIVFGPSGDLFVSSRIDGRGTGQILRYDGKTGEFVDAFVELGSGGLDNPNGLVFGPDGDLYVASRNTDEVLQYDGASGAFQGAFVTAGSGGLKDPHAVTFGPDGNLYVSMAAGAGTAQVLRYDGQTGAFLDEFVPAERSGRLRRPLYLAFGPDGRLYVTSSLTHDILRFDGTTGAFLDEFVSATKGELDNPSGFLFGPDGNFYVSNRGLDGNGDMRGGVKRFGPSSQTVFTVSLSHPSDQLVSVDYSTLERSARAGDDFQSQTGSLVFLPGVTSRAIIIPTFASQTDETTKNFEVRLSNPEGAAIRKATGLGTIYDEASAPPNGMAIAEEGASKGFNNPEVVFAGTFHRFGRGLARQQWPVSSSVALKSAYLCKSVVRLADGGFDKSLMPISLPKLFISQE